MLTTAAQANLSFQVCQLFWGDVGEVVSRNCPISPPFQAQGEVVLHRIYRKNIPKDYHFYSKSWKMVITSPCFKFVGLYHLKKCFLCNRKFLYKQRLLCIPGYILSLQNWRMMERIKWKHYAKGEKNNIITYTWTISILHKGLTKKVSKNYCKTLLKYLLSLDKMAGS